jgi:hypothetical protein
MSMIRSDSKPHETTCAIAESNRQAAVAAAGSSAAAVKAADVWRSTNVYRAMSDVGDKAEVICSFRVFRLLTHFGHWP